MSDLAFDYVEAGMRFARLRAAALAEDVANARTPGFVPHDLARAENGSADPGSVGGAPFSAVLHQVAANGTVGLLEYAMSAQAKNAVAYRALAEQERAMLRELRTVAQEARR
jgi:flagellar basal body rod protein FlgB